MLYNVIIGNNQKVNKDWRVLEENGSYFYDKPDLRQRIRIDQSLDHTLTQLYRTDNVQCYDFGEGKRWRSNTSNFNPALRPLVANKANKDTSEQIIIYVTMMNNYQMVDFETDYSIMNTYHKKKEWQGCVLVMTAQEVETLKKRQVLRIFAYNKKKEQPVTIELSFGKYSEETMEAKGITSDIDISHLGMHIKSIKDKDEKERVLKMVEKYKDSYLGFKCIIHPNVLVTSTYFVSKKYEEMMNKIVKFKNRQIVVVDDETLKDKEKLSDLVARTCAPRKIRAITVVGLHIPLDVISENRLLYVFTYCDGVHKGLSCIKSN